MIPKSDPRHAAAQAALDAMHAFRELAPDRGAVQWIEDTDGRVIMFTRGEYRDVLMKAVHNVGTPVETFELEGEPDEESSFFVNRPD